MASNVRQNSVRNCEASLDRILSSVQQSETNVINQIETIRNHLNTEQNVDTIQITTTVLERIGNNVGRFRSGNPMEIISALFDVVSGAVSAIPVVGPLIGKVFGLLSYIFGMFGNKGKGMSIVVRRIIEDALDQFEDTTLRRKAEGTRRAFAVSSAFLSGMDGGVHITAHEIASLGGYVPVYQGVEYLAILGSKLREYTLVSGQHEKAICFIKSYCELAFLRYAVLFQMYSVVRSTGHSEFLAQSILNVINCDKEEDCSVLLFLTQPKLDNVVFFSKVNFGDERLQSLRNFMQFIDLELQNLSFLTQGEYTLRPTEWNHRKMSYNCLNIVEASNQPGTNGAIVFTATEENNVFFMNTRAYPGWNLYMVKDTCGFVRGTTNDKEGAERWKVVQLQDGTFMFSNKKWTDWFMYMVDTPAGWVRGSKGIPPGRQGNWRIERLR